MIRVKESQAHGHKIEITCDNHALVERRYIYQCPSFYMARPFMEQDFMDAIDTMVLV